MTNIFDLHNQSGKTTPLTIKLMCVCEVGGGVVRGEKKDPAVPINLKKNLPTNMPQFMERTHFN